MTTDSSSIDTRYATRLGAIMAIVGGIVFMMRRRRAQPAAAAVALTDAERDQLDSLMTEDS